MRRDRGRGALQKETKGISLASIDTADAATLEADRNRPEVGAK
jgi:hypothetical protein